MDEPNRRSRAFPAGLAYAPQAIRWVVMSAQELSSGAISQDWLRLALEEAVTNICRHAYPSNSDAKYGVAVWRDGTDLVVELSDWGAPFNPLTAPVAGDIAHSDLTGGLGLPLLRACIEHPSYVRRDSMNVLRFRVPITSCPWTTYGGDPYAQ